VTTTPLTSTLRTSPCWYEDRAEAVVANPTWKATIHEKPVGVFNSFCFRIQTSQATILKSIFVASRNQKFIYLLVYLRIKEIFYVPDLSLYGDTNANPFWRGHGFGKKILIGYIRCGIYYLDASKNISGLQDQDFPVLQCADDNLIFMQGDATQLTFLKNLLSRFFLEQVAFNLCGIQFWQIRDGSNQLSKDRLDLLESTFGCSKDSLPFTYLGLPLSLPNPQ
jgi:hypothetical protein